MDISQQSDALSQMVEENKGLLKEQHKAELKKEASNKKKAAKDKKIKEKTAKEEKLMK